MLQYLRNRRQSSLVVLNELEKQSFADVLPGKFSSSKEVLLKISQYSEETPVLKSLFNEAAGLKAFNFIKKRLQHRCFPVNIAKFLKTAFL